MPNNPKKSSLCNMAIFFSWIYWFYLACTSQMIIVHDAIGYENLGTLIHQQGFIEYLKQGPQREPIYPLLIALAMNIGQLFSISYQSILILFQLTLLGLTQILTLQILKKFQINSFLIFLTLLYGGFSPALVNAALSCFSEIPTFPLITSIILVTLHSQNALQKNNALRCALSGFGLGALFLLITFIKGPYSIIFLCALLPYFFLLTKTLSQKKYPYVKNILILIITMLISFYIPMHAYKNLNKHLNGHYAFVNKSRGIRVLYHSAALRSEKLSSRRILSALAYIPGSRYCTALFGEKECAFWSTQNLESFGHRPEYKNIGTQFANDPDQVNAAYLKAIKRNIIQHPFQFTLLMSLDALKLFFWETTDIGFVIYPKKITQLFKNYPFADSLRFILTTLSLFSFFYLLQVILKNKNRSALFPYHVLIIIIAAHITLYAFCAASVSRHTLPIAPLFLLAIPLSLNHLFSKKEQEN